MQGLPWFALLHYDSSASGSMPNSRCVSSTRLSLSRWPVISCGLMFLYSRTPVPAGISLPMMTFSLRPMSGSTLFLMAASVSTRAVSWKDAAERKESVDSAALVIPSSTRFAVAGRPPFSMVFSFSSSKVNISTSSPGSISVSPQFSMRTLRIIWRTMISTCLSLMSTPCER